MLPNAKDWFRVLFRGDEILRINCAAARLVPLRIRALRSSDVDACLAIYKSNEANRFPPGYYGVYNEYLTSGRSLVLVVEKDSRVVATGGIVIFRSGRTEVPMLSFGMVLPDYQRQG